MSKQNKGSASLSSSCNTLCSYPVSSNMKYRQAGVIFDQKMGKEFLNIEMLLMYWTPALGSWGLWKCSFMSELQNSTLGNAGYLKVRLPH